MSLSALAWIAVGGAIGSVMRYAFGLVILSRTGPGFPWGTFWINVIGSLLIGVVVEIAQTRAVGLPDNVRLFLTVGVLGGFTTFSSFAFETLTLASDGALWLAASYAAGSVAIGVAAVVAGMAGARLLLR